MIRISDATGSREFIRPLRRAGATCQLRPLARMPFGDFWFWGYGRQGRCRVGVERKTLSEIVSAIGDNRFIGHQLPGLLKTYTYTFIVIEGDRYIDPKSGLLNPLALKFLPTRAHIYHTVQKFELTLMLKGGVRVVYTKNKGHTTAFVRALYDWFSEPWAKHKSVYQVEEDKPDQAILSDRTMKRKVANQLTGLAWTRSLKADAHFRSIVEMVSASAEEWATALQFKTVGKVPRAIHDVCHRRDDVKSKGR